VTGGESASAQARLRYLLRDHVAPVLREHGFAGSGQDPGEPAAEQRRKIRRAITGWGERAVGHDRASLAHLLRQLTSA
jgi:hypothetical protein